MSQKRPHILSSLLLALLAFGFGSVDAAPDPRTVAIEKAKKAATGCDDCFFFALPTQNALFKKHSLYVVSTLDRLPPPFWTIAIPKRGGALLLSATETGDWNRMISKERLKLKDDATVEAYVKAFIDLAVGRALYIDKLNSRELALVRKKRKRAVAKSLQIHREKKLLSISFYAKDVTKQLTRWDLLVRPNGTILKADQTRF